jgi:hypothetical protein
VKKLAAIEAWPVSCAEPIWGQIQVAQGETRGSAPISGAHIFTPGTWPKVCDAVAAKGLSGLLNPYGCALFQAMRDDNEVHT